MAKKQRSGLSVLLITSRTDKKMRLQEVRCVQKYTGLRREQLITHNIYERGLKKEAVNENNFDAVIFGGTGDFGVHEMQKLHPEAYEELKQTMVYCLENEIPTLSICMQFPTVIFGGEVARDPDKKELGTASVKLTEEAKTDTLLRDTPVQFHSKVGHNDSTIKVPPEAVVLAESTKCVQIYRLGENFYFTQSHFELGTDEFRERLEHYADDYASNQEEYERLMSEDDDVSTCTSLMSKFIDYVVLGD